MTWDTAHTIALARASCSSCHGRGMQPLRFGARDRLPCPCVFRAIFRACYERYRECRALAEHTNGVALERQPGPRGYRSYGRMREEFVADFELIARRLLTPEAYRAFAAHYVAGRDWRGCCQRLGIDRGTFYRHIYAAEVRLGRALAEMQPYALFPMDEYFAHAIVRGASAA